jgi:organic hydroperoxide reductase OsmC/OhrA
MTVHEYSTHLVWSGSTGAGSRTYQRRHQAVARPARTTVELSADAAFGGDPDLLNPEQLLVMAASSCQLLSFLALAARQNIDVLDYEDEAQGTMDESDKPVRVNRIILAPVIRVLPGTDHDTVRALVARAHEHCFIANSLTSAVSLEPTVLDG